MTNLSQIAKFSPAKKKTYNKSKHYFEVTSAKLSRFESAYSLDRALEVFDELPVASLWISEHKRGYFGKRRLLQRKGLASV